ncbi:outer membrane receptor protein involved in Fe transport [Arcicella aurantiaca]|uniref:Outer membrane receptor protein involved in Fe transport n=1 Tax=Arcicella aurantiaca TaxID=591202 RepID=A0A316E157_9BACT|nr:outer membrane beta-barrel family protein [Arcicella aurantiaca]PWK23835.1 outer membrane receptor protein involved in Fe transport [Arcicella aurantiaca]
MKLLLSALLAAFISLTSVAQMPFGTPAKGAKAPEMNFGKIIGKIVDEQGKPVEFASVVLLKTVQDTATKQNKDILVKAVQGEMNGEFSMKDLPVMGRLKLKISSVGYKTLEMPIAFQFPKMDGSFAPPKPGQQPDPAMIAKFMAGFEKDLGKLKLENDNKVLDAVVVTATKALVEMDIDKKTFNVDKNIVTAGGTAVDVMRNIPSVQVDIDGNVKVRNAAPTLFIDGRPTTLSLDQIPADVIEKVEVITNPSAKYDASGSMAGIINVVLKKNKRNGYNGFVNAGADRFGGSNLMGSFNLQQKKVNLSLMLMNFNMRNNTNGYSERTSTIGGINSNVYQDIESKTKGSMVFSRLGLDYNLTNKTSFSIAGILGSGQFSPSEDIDIKNTTSGFTSYSNRISSSERSFKPRGGQMGFKHSFAKAGEELTVDLTYFGGTNKNDGLYSTNYLNGTQITGTQIQKNIGSGDNKFMTFQTDYVKPLKNEVTLETGLRFQLNELSNINDNSLKAVGSDTYKNITSASTNYESKNNVYAAYISLAGKVKKLFSYKVGLRGESSAYDGKLLNTGEKFSNRYPISLFPSVFLSKNLTQSDQIQLSVTRRVNRPNFFQIIPFVDYSDSLNITRGNADLVPEFTTSSEFSYSKTKGSATFLTSVYYKHTNNLITRYLNQEVNPISGKLDLINTYINANSSINYGAEFTYTNKIVKWWDITANVNFYNSKINIDNIDKGVSTDALWTVFGKLNNNITLPKKWVIQVSGDYQGKTNLPITQNQGMGGPPMNQAQSSSQGYIKPFYGFDLAIKKTFLKNDLASLTLSVNDIFKTRGNTQVSTGEGFTQTYYRISNPQIVRLNLSFRFGKMDMSSLKKSSNSSNMEGMQMQ